MFLKILKFIKKFDNKIKRLIYRVYLIHSLTHFTKRGVNIFELNDELNYIITKFHYVLSYSKLVIYV